MCLGQIFGARQPQPIAAPSPIQPRNPDLAQVSNLPSKKELLDPDDVAGVEYGTSAKKSGDERGAAKRTGTDALKINIAAGEGGGSGGLNV